MGIAEIVYRHKGRMVDPRHSKCAFVQRHVGKDVEKDFLAILDAEGPPVLMIGAMEGPSLPDAACRIALRTNGHLKHLAFCA